MPPCQIVPALADEGTYIASESTFYRILHEEKMQNHRGRSQEPGKHSKPTSYCATAPNQIWTWDITYLSGAVKGMFYYLYLIIDIFSRDIVGWEVWAEESAEHASELIRRACLAQGRLSTQPLVLHSDNGSPMKGATMLQTLYRLGITPSNSRPRVSNDNPYSESLFRTLKYRPNYQPRGFASIEEAREWCRKFVQWYRYEHHHSGITVGIPETGAILRKYILIPTIIMRNPTPGRMIRTIQIQKNQHSSGVSLPGHLFPSVLFMHTASRKALLEEAGDRRGRAPRTALTCRKPSSCVLPAYNERAITVRVIVSAGSPVIGTIAGRGKNVTVKGPWNKSQHRARARMREFMPRKPLTGT